MGTAWLARDTLLMRPCVIKVLHETSYDEEGRVERFLRESRLTARLRHEHVVATYDLGVAETGVPFLVLEQLEGRPLDTLLRERGAMPVARVIAIGIQILRGLVAAHAAGVVHHDLKPANVFLTHNGVVKLLDFGIAAFVGSQEELRDDTRETAGTPFYMAPEQWHGTRADVRSDVWAVGVVLFELLTGRVPFAGTTPSAVALAVLSEEPNYPVALHIPGHAELVALIQHAIQKKPEQRPADAATMLQSLESLWTSVVAGSSATIQSASTKSPQTLDADVGFTVHSPPTLAPGQWTQLLAFVHRTPQDAEREALGYDDPIVEVARQAREVLGDQADVYEQHDKASPMLVPREHELTFALRAQGVQFDPPSRTFVWTEPVHRELFLAQPDGAAGTTQARLEVFLGALLLAEVRFDLHIGETSQTQTRSTGRPFEQVFVAYADADQEVARQLETLSSALSSTRFVQADSAERAAGAVGPTSQAAIDQADAMQVLWSTQALESDFVDSAVRYALDQHGVAHIRPVCWETPAPIDEGRDRPPEALRKAGLSSIAAPMTALLAMVANAQPPMPMAGAAPSAASGAAPAAPPPMSVASPALPSDMDAMPPRMSARSGGGGGGWMILALLVLIAAAVAFWLLR